MNALTSRFALLRYPLIVLVVLIHADNRELWVAGERVVLRPQGDVALGVRLLLSQGLARVAVPLMFAIAGYLFFLNFDGSWKALQRKWKSRALTLLVPYLGWGGLHVAVQWSASGHWPGGLQALQAVLGITRPPLVFHLWFIRDLIFMVLCAPLVYVMVRCWPWPSVLLPIGVYVSGWWGLPRPGIVGIAFFILGAALGLRGWAGRSFDEWPKRWMGAYAVLLVADSWDSGHFWSDSLNRITLLVGCGAFLAAAGWVQRSAAAGRIVLERWAAASFFLYAAHEPLQRLLRSALVVLLPSGFDPGGYVLYFAPAVLVCILLTVCYFMLVQRITWLRTILAGGR